VGVAPEFENRMSSIEMRVSTIYTEMHRMSEMMERFISGTVAPNQQQPAAHLSGVVLESDPVQATLPPEQGYEQQLLRQDEQVHRPRMRVRKNRVGKRLVKSSRTAPSDALKGSTLYEDEPGDDDDEVVPLVPHSSRSRSPAVKARRGNSSMASESERSSGARNADTGVAESDDESTTRTEMDERIEVPIGRRTTRGK
jgi:hypothetical protein